MTLPRACKLMLSAGLAALLAVPVRQAQEVSAGGRQTIHVNVDRVDVGVTVTDNKGKFVPGLKFGDFHVFDNGVEQSIVEFAPVDEPGQIFLLLEAGPAVYFLQDAHLFAADAFLNGLSTGDRVAIGRYAETPVVVLDFTPEKRIAQAALTAIRFNLGFGQLNLSSSLDAVLDWLALVPGKKTIVLLSTGVDTSSQEALEGIQSRLGVGDVRIVAISVSGPLRSGKAGSRSQVQETQQAFETADARLNALAEATGGRVYFPQNAKAFQAIYREVAQFIRNEYSLSFAPPVSDGAVHRIAVKVALPGGGFNNKTPDFRVDHRKAYIAPKPASAQ
jgi:Ca-activated chloride channel homolog